MKRSRTIPVPVRISPETQVRIRKAAKKLGSNTSALIRFAVINQLPQIETGRIILNPDEELAV